MIAWPEFISFEAWSADLIRVFSNEKLPVGVKEDNWQEFAVTLTNTGIFKRANIPPPSIVIMGRKQDSFKSWQEWAKVAYLNILKARLVYEKRK